MNSIDKRSNLSYKEFEKEYLFPRKPVVITDATLKWKAYLSVLQNFSIFSLYKPSSVLNSMVIYPF